MSRSLKAVLFVALLCCGNRVWSQSTDGDQSPARLPTLRFFYYDADNIEWVTDAEPERWQQHLNTNALSEQFFATLTAAVADDENSDQARAKMTQWIEQEREQFNGYNPARFRRAEGTVAYLRAHDFKAKNLVAALLKRSAAQDVELVAVHLVDETAGDSFQLKVALPGHETNFDRQGFNISLQQETVSHTVVVYCLAVALYELHEIINTETSGDDGDLTPSPIEELPAPEIF